VPTAPQRSSSPSLGSTCLCPSSPPLSEGFLMPPSHTSWDWKWTAALTANTSAYLMRYCELSCLLYQANLDCVEMVMVFNWCVLFIPDTIMYMQCLSSDKINVQTLANLHTLWWTKWPWGIHRGVSYPILYLLCVVTVYLAYTFDTFDVGRSTC